MTAGNSALARPRRIHRFSLSFVANSLSGLVAVFTPCSNSSLSLPHFMFSPSPVPTSVTGTMASADSCRFSHSSGMGCQITWRFRQVSLGKSAVFPSMCPPHLFPAAFGRDFALCCKLIQLPLPQFRELWGRSRWLPSDSASPRTPLP